MKNKTSLLLFPLIYSTPYLAEDDIEPALVSGVGDDDEDGEEEQGEDGLPDLHLVLGQGASMSAAFLWSELVEFTRL